MNIPKSVEEIITQHVLFEIESIDRMYLNLYMDRVQSAGGTADFFVRHRKEACATALVMSQMTQKFLQKIEKFAQQHSLEIIPFEKHARKDDIAQQYLAEFPGREGVLFIGKAQEKCKVFRTITKVHPQTGKTFPSLIRTTAMVNHYYFYCVDKDFGPFFIKFCSYFPYTARLCLNGNEYLKRQLENKGIPFEPLDNGLKSCADPRRAQQIADGMSEEKINRFIQKWLAFLPDPYSKADHDASYHYKCSILQIELSLTQVFDRPQNGRLFFEQIISDNLTMGRAENIQLIFGRKIIKTTPSEFRTRVIAKDVIPSFKVVYKNSTVKQYFKEGRALRTETTINDTRDFYVGRLLCNLPKLREIGFRANRQLLRVERLRYDPMTGQAEFERMMRPMEVNECRVSGFTFGDSMVLALMSCLLVYRFQIHGLTNKELRGMLVEMTGTCTADWTAGRMTYQLRRLRLRGLIVREAGSQRYRITDWGLRTAAFYTSCFRQVIYPNAENKKT
jgi:hypothetical protein